MELYLLRPAEFQLRYNCSFYSVEAVPLAVRQHPAFGWGLIALFVLFETLYIPCVAVLWRQRNHSSCYKFMLYIGVVDVLCLPMNALLTGIFAIQGAVYCTYPTLMFFTGIWGNALWHTESTAAVFLALNRCVELTSPYWAAVLYEGNRVWWWLLIPSCYALFDVFFMTPVAFSSILVAWFFNPHVGYFEDTQGVYTSIHGAAHNLSIAVILPTLYLIFALLLLSQGRAATDVANTQSTSAQRAAFGQVALISAVNAAGASVYTYMQFFPQHTSPALIQSASYAWALVCGSPALVYLTLNRSIKKESLRLVAGFLRIGGVTLSSAQVGPSNYNNHTTAVHIGSKLRRSIQAINITPTQNHY